MKAEGLMKKLKGLLPDTGSVDKEKKQDDTSRPVRIGIWVLLIGFGSMLLWAALAPLDEGVPCQGTVSIATKSKVVQHLDGGVIDSVHVKEGQFVEQGEVLLSLYSQKSRARYEDVHQRYLALRAAESRLEAEQQGKLEISFHDDLLNDPDQDLVLQFMQNEKKLFSARQRVLRLLKEQLAGIRGLVSEGYAPLDQQRELEKKIAEINLAIASEMAQVRREVEAGAEKSKALADELSKTKIRAPVSGQVVGLQVQTVGAVIQGGEKLMSVVPVDENLLVEVKVAPHLIDRVRSGLVADVRFASFSHSPQLVVEGVVESVSSDLLVEPKMNPLQKGATYYLALVAITPEGVKVLGDRQMQPGMPVQAIIKTGERSLLTYLLHPLIKRVSASMKEE